MIKLLQECKESFKLAKMPLSENDAFDIVTIMINFHIPLRHAKYLIAYLRKLMRVYGSYIEVLRDILDINGYQKYFMIYSLAKNYKHIYSNITEEKQCKFMFNLFDEFSISAERFKDYIKFIDEICLEEAEKGLFSPWGFKKIMEGNFDNNEKDLLIFIYGLT